MSRRRWRRGQTTDELTGLLTRTALLTTLEAWPASRNAAIVIIDIDRFSEVIDAIGTDAADSVLALLGDRAGTIGVADLATRWGSDEFAVVVPDVIGRQALAELGNAAVRTMTAPIAVGDREVTITAHAAVGGFPDQARRWAELIPRVDLTLRRTKMRPEPVAVYDPHPDHARANDSALAGELRRALENDEIRLRYQPRVRLSDGAVTGAEALIRWRHPKRGLLQPGAFIPSAEAAGLIGAVTRRVLELAIADASEWHTDGRRLHVGVNLSPDDLKDVALVRYVEELLDKSALPSELLTLEITETAFMADAALGGELLNELCRLGCTVSIDDFGTGYSSLSRVASMPARELKIDRGFVNELWSPGTDAVVNATIELAHSLDMKVVAEGVETAEQYSRLTELGCDEAQGYWLGKPMALAQFLREAATWDSDSTAVVPARSNGHSPLVVEDAEPNLPVVSARSTDLEIDLDALPAPPPPRRRERLRRAAAETAERIGTAPLLAGGVYVLVFLLWSLLGGGGWANAAVTGSLTAATAALCWRTAMRSFSSTAQAWWLLGAAAGAHFLSELAGVVNGPASDVLLASMYPLAALGILAFPATTPRRARERLKLSLDVATIGVAVAALVWFVIEPALRAGAMTAAFKLHPVGDVVLVTAVTIALLRETATPVAGLRWVAGGLLGVAGADLANTWLAARGAHSGNALIDLAGHVALGAIAAGAFVSRAPGAMGDAGTAIGGRRFAVWLSYGSFLGVELLLLGTAWQTHPAMQPLRGVLGTAVLLMVLATSRQLLSLQDNIALVDRYTALARTDALTGLANRRRLMDDGERLFERCRRSGETISALMVDIDHFKLANDSRGHAVGDAILRHVAELSARNVRTGDLVGRYGGDEIVILLSGANADVALELGQRLNRAAAESAPSGIGFALTVSVGVADSSSATTLGGLIRNADRALYDAKRAGRNQAAAYRASLLALPSQFD